MKKIIKLTESDLVRLVKRIINEGATDDIYKKLIARLKNAGFKLRSPELDGFDDSLAELGISPSNENEFITTPKNGMSVIIHISNDNDIFAMVEVEGQGIYGHKMGSIQPKKIVNDTLNIYSMIKKGADKKYITQLLSNYGFYRYYQQDDVKPDTKPQRPPHPGKNPNLRENLAPKD